MASTQRVQDGKHYVSDVVGAFFLTAFAFLNMVIGIVVNVMEEEGRKARAAAEKLEHEEEEATLNELRQEIRELKSLVQSLSKS